MIRQAIGAYVFDGHSIRKNIVIRYTDQGEIIDVTPWNGTETANSIYFSGLLVPGFVNAHCHLELSHLHKKIAPQQGMSNFIQEVVAQRKAELSLIENACKMADNAMYHNGIVAVGDIANTLDTKSTKEKSKIYYHTFVECFGLNPEAATNTFTEACKISEHFSPLKASVTQHAPYSTSNQLFSIISKFAEENNSLLSIHNQESEAEQNLFLLGEGALFEHFNNLGLPLNEKAKLAKSPLQHTTQLLPKKGNVVLVHNTFTSENDIDFLQEACPKLNISYCICPLSNKYINNAEPPIDLFVRKQLAICIGTDSLASNNSLSILSELLLIQKLAPHLALEDMLKWATYNGAKMLRVDDKIGSFSSGKIPGILQLDPIDLKSMKLLPDTKVRRII